MPDLPRKLIITFSTTGHLWMQLFRVQGSSRPCGESSRGEESGVVGGCHWGLAPKDTAQGRAASSMFWIFQLIWRNHRLTLIGSLVWLLVSKHLLVFTGLATNGDLPLFCPPVPKGDHRLLPGPIRDTRVKDPEDPPKHLWGRTLPRESAFLVSWCFEARWFRG